MRTKKIGIVVQRAGQSIVGGSEAYAMKMAGLLKDTYEIDIISTCAIDHVSWKNEIAPGTEIIDNNLRIIRFENDFERSGYWHSLNTIINNDVDIFSYIKSHLEKKQTIRDRLKNYPLGICEEWMKYQGPYSTDLFQFIKNNQNEYDLFVFMTYLYPTTYFGIKNIERRDKIVVIPTFHDEPYAFLPIFLNFSDLYHFFLTNQERVLAEELIYQEPVAHDIIGFGLDNSNYLIEKKTKDYFIYVGRLEEAKGVHQMYEMFSAFNQQYPEIKLYTIGKGPLEKNQNPNIIYKGFVDDETKYQLINGAIGLIQPSALESLGIVLLEAFMMKTPVIVNAESKVLEEHIHISEGGFTYHTENEFIKALESLMMDSKQQACGSLGYDYFQKFYSTKKYKERLIEKLNLRLENLIAD